MKKHILKIAIFAVILVMTVALCTSCEILDVLLGAQYEGPCSHSNVTEGSCIELPTCLSAEKR